MDFFDKNRTFCGNLIRRTWGNAAGMAEGSSRKYSDLVIADFLTSMQYLATGYCCDARFTAAHVNNRFSRQREIQSGKSFE
jgi:hypothetical protein